MYLLCRLLKQSKSAIVAHLNHGARGRHSDQDQGFVERLGRSMGLPVEVRKVAMTKASTEFEKTARNERYAFLRELKKKHGAERILVGHTADDQVETVLIRILEGAGIAGLKGIPRKTAEGVERPLVDTWREEILEYLHNHKIAFRVDRSNLDTRFERNWIRHVLVPLLEKRYGKSVKKRIFALGERFREIDEFLEDTARSWIARHLKGDTRIPRKRLSRLPSAARKKVLQILCFERAGIAPNERLLESMDRLIVRGGPSARLNIGKKGVLGNRYEEAILEGPAGRGSAASKKKGRQRARSAFLKVEQRGTLAPATIKNLTKGERAAVFDAEAIADPLAVRPLRAGDRIRPFGLDAEKKVKEILIDRKVPREERWGRPVVCDAGGRILWIPGIVRSSHASVTGKTRRTAVLRMVGTGENALA